MSGMKSIFPLAVFLSCITPLFAQKAVLTGSVRDMDGKPVAGATIGFQIYEDHTKRVEATTDKKGNFARSNMQPGLYTYFIEVDGKLRAQVNYYLSGAGVNRDFDVKLGPENATPMMYDCKPESVNCIIFDVRKPKVVSVAASGLSLPPTPPPPAVAKGASKEEKETVKQREEQLAQRAAVNGLYSDGKIALAARQYDVAIENLTKAAAIEPRQPLIWSGLGEAYSGLAVKSPSDERKENYNQAIEAYKKAIALRPDDAGMYNDYAVVLASSGKLDDAKTSLAKAIELDPAHQGQFHFNMAAILANSGQVDPALDEFRLSVAADPGNADAHYQYGVTLFGKATVNAAGKMVAPPGTAEELQKSLDLQPDGPNAGAAKELIAAMGVTVNTNYKDPAAKTPASGSKAPATKKGK